MARKDDMWVRRFVVSDPIKHKKGFTLYKITSVVFPKQHPEAVTKIVVWKRYNDFKKLHKEMKSKYQKLELPEKFPPFVKARFFKRFEEDVIEERRQSALVLLEFVAQHTALFTSDVFVKFFQVGYTVNNTTGTVEKIEPCQNGLLQPFPIDSSWSPTFRKRDEGELVLTVSSEDDVTSFTTDTDSAIGSPIPTNGEFTWPVSTDIPDTDGNSENRRKKETRLPNLKTIFKHSSSSNESSPKKFSHVRNLTTAPRNSYSKIKIKEIPLSFLWKPIDDLQYFKVLGIYIKVMLVLDTRDDSLHVIKALQKTPCPMYTKQCTIFPQQIPYMVELYGIFETCTAVYLVIEHISSGKLWDYITPFFPKSTYGNTINQNKLSKKFLNDDEMYCEDNYELRKLSSDSNCSISTDLTTKLYCSQSSLSSDNENSYLELIRDYRSCNNANEITSSKDIESIQNSLSSENIASESVFKTILNYSKSDGAINLNNNVVFGGSDRSILNSDVKMLESDKKSVGLLDIRETDDEIDKKSDKLDLITNKTVLNGSIPDINEVPMFPNSFNNGDNKIRNEIPDILIDNLVENARKLLKSVDETLSKSDNLVSKLNSSVTSVDKVLQSSEHLECDYKSKVSVEANIDDIKLTKSLLITKENVSNSSSPDSRHSKSPTHLLHQHNNLTLQPPSLYSRGGSPTSSVSTDGENIWWKHEIEGNGLKEETVKKWGAQLLVAIYALHNAGVICRDLNPDNILVHDGSIRLTYFCQFAGVEPPPDYKALKRLYCAPEVTSIFSTNESVDWWSYGAILYELLTGETLLSNHPGGIHCHTILYVPDRISLEAQSLLRGLLHFNPSDRICSGIAGIDELKCHPFFDGVNWEKVYVDGIYKNQ